MPTYCIQLQVHSVHTLSLSLSHTHTHFHTIWGPWTDRAKSGHCSNWLTEWLTWKCCHPLPDKQACCGLRVCSPVRAWGWWTLTLSVSDQTHFASPSRRARGWFSNHAWSLSQSPSFTILLPHRPAYPQKALSGNWGPKTWFLRKLKDSVRNASHRAISESGNISLRVFREFVGCPDKGRLLSTRVVTSNASALVVLSASRVSFCLNTELARPSQFCIFFVTLARHVALAVITPAMSNAKVKSASATVAKGCTFRRRL